MLDLKLIVSETDRVIASMKKRGNEKAITAISSIVEMDKERRSAILEVETLKAKRNAASQEIAKLKKSGGDDTTLLNDMKLVAFKIKELDEVANSNIEKLNHALLELPNVLDTVVPEGKDAASNLEVKKWGEIPKFDFPIKAHDEIGEQLGIIDFKKAGEVTGARFVFLRGIAAKLERALIQFMLDTHSKVGYEEICPPFLVNKDTLTGTGQLPKFEEDVFKIEKFGFYLIPTAEVPVTNYYRQEIVDEKILPKKFTAYTPCFRSEAGSYGKDTKGLKRQHQFNKVELVKFVAPENSMQELELLVQDAEKILQLLKLPYRVMQLCGGDTGFASTKTYDIEVWSPFQKGYMEISSCSNCTDFQARRAGIRYRDHKAGKVHFVHTLNGSGLAVGRTLIAIMENYQKADGTFDIPEVLKPYLNK